MLLALLVLSVKMTYDIARVRDLTLGDEPSYMRAASLIPTEGLPPPDNAPLYCLWYHALSWVQHDPVHLYYLGWQALVFLVVASLYLLCRSAGGSRAGSLLAAFFVLNSAVVEVWPYPSYLAFVILAIGTAVATRFRSWAHSQTVLGLTLLVSSYVRPELAVSFLVFGLVALGSCGWVVLRRSRQAWKWLIGVLLVFSSAALFVHGIGNPLGGGRSFVAFSQHYTFNVVAAEQLSLSPCSHYPEIITRDFGQAASFLQAWEVNPRAVLWHVLVNASRIPTSVGQLVEDRLDLSYQAGLVLAALLSGAVVLGGAGLARRLLAHQGPGESRRGLAVVLLMLTVLLVPTVASSLMVYPRLHYLMPVVLFLFALVGPGLRGLPRLRSVRTWLDRRGALLALFVVLLAVTPNRVHGCHVQRLLGRPPDPPALLVHQTTQTALRRLSIRGPAAILDAIDSSRNFYAGLPAQYVPTSAKQGRFWDFVRQANIGIIVLDSLLMNEVCYRDDPEFQEFVSGKRAGDFLFIGVPETPVRIAVRKDLLGRPVERPFVQPSSLSTYASSGGAARSIAPDTGG
jgi:hypothetical protein